MGISVFHKYKTHRQNLGFYSQISPTSNYANREPVFYLYEYEHRSQNCFVHFKLSAFISVSHKQLFPTLQSSSRTCLSSSEFSSHAWSPSPSAQFSSPEQLESHCCRRDCPGKKMAQLVLSLIVDFNCFHAPSAARTINNSAWGEGRRKEIVVENVFLMHPNIFLQFYTRQARKKIPHSQTHAKNS